MALETGLTHGWRLEGNSVDSVSTLNGTDTAITYSAANAKIQIGAGFASASPSRITLSPITTTAFSIVAWIKTSTASNQGIINFAGNGAYFRVDSAGTLSLVKEAALNIATSSGNVKDGVYHMVGVTYDSSGNYVFYIDGATAGSGTNLQTLSTGGSAYIGTESSHGENFNGAIDEVYTWSTIKTGGEMTSLYNSGVGMHYNGSTFITGATILPSFYSVGVNPSNVAIPTFGTPYLFVSYVGSIGVDDITSISAGGTAMSLIAKDLGTGTNARYTYLWGLANPPTGTITFSINGGAPAGVSGTAVYLGIATTGQPDASNHTKNGDGSTTITTSVTTVKDNCWVVAWVSSSNGNKATADTGMLARDISDTSQFMDNNAVKSPAGAFTVNAKMASGSASMVLLACSISPVSSTAYTMAVTVGAFTLTGQPITFHRVMNMVVSVGTFALTGIAAGLYRGRKMSVTVGQFILSGANAIFTLRHWTPESKHSVTGTNQTKHTSAWTNQPKH